MMEVRFPPLRIDSKFRLFRFKNPKGDMYSLSIKCNEANEPFFKRLCEVIAKVSYRLVPKVNGKKSKPEDFELVKDSKVGTETFIQRFTRENLEKSNAAYPLNLLKIRFQ